MTDFLTGMNLSDRWLGDTRGYSVGSCRIPRVSINSVPIWLLSNPRNGNREAWPIGGGEVGI